MLTLPPMKLSVVIPVFHVEQTLDRCVQSVLQQQVADMQVILVDDGSDDRCPLLCDQWALRDQRVSVIHQPNGGLSEARNAGIRQATGEYLTFVDSDDFLAPDTYAPLLSLLAKHPEYDLLEFPCSRLQLSDSRYSDMNDYWLHGRAYLHTYAWNKLYRRQLFSNVRFPSGKVFEDVFTLPLLLRHCHVVATTSQGFYHYTVNPEGITCKAGGPELLMLLEAHLNVLKSGFPKADDDYYMHVVNIYMDVRERLGRAPSLPPRNVSPLRVSDIKQKVKAFILNTLGINSLCQINQVIHKVSSHRS